MLRRLDGLLHGDYRTLFRGFGLDLADLREYQYHDDVRHIDWNVTARLQTPYVREFNEDREVDGVVPARPEPSVDFGSRRSAQAHRCRPSSSRCSRALLTRHGNRVGALFYGDRVDTVIPPRSGRRHVLHLLQPHDGAAEPPRSTQPAGDRSRATCCIAGARHDQAPLAGVRRVRLHQRAGLGASRCAQLAQRHEVIAVRLYDPLEMELPDLGLVVMQDAETGEQLFVDTHDRASASASPAAAAEREAELRDGVRAAPASTRSSLRPTTTWSTRSCASPSCASAAASSRRRRRDCLPHLERVIDDLPLA